jgi:hypothetical protein
LFDLGQICRLAEDIAQKTGYGMGSGKKKVHCLKQRTFNPNREAGREPSSITLRTLVWVGSGVCYKTQLAEMMPD